MRGTKPKENNGTCGIRPYTKDDRKTYNANGIQCRALFVKDKELRNILIRTLFMMIGFSFYNRTRTINLFCKNHTHHLVTKCHF